MGSSSDSVEFVEVLKLGIANILEDAKERIIIVCPYVRLDDVQRLTERLITALDGGVEATLIIRNEAKQRDEALGAFRDRLRGGGLNFLAVKNLHAKIYMSETKAIVSSVNLLESSFVHGLEVGLAVPAGALYNRLLDFVDLTLLDSADVIFGRKPDFRRPPVRQAEPAPSGVVSVPATNALSPPAPALPPGAAATGHCIRCSSEIPMDPTRPFCAKDQKTWARYKDEDYPEVYCLVCGQEKKTTKAKPMCSSCYRKVAKATA